MQKPKPIRRLLLSLCSLLAVCVLLTPAGYCWARQAGHGTTQDQPPDLVEALKRDRFDDFDLERIAKAHDLQAIDVLEERFQQRHDHTLGVQALQAELPSASKHSDGRFETDWSNMENELHIASVLIRLGVKDDVYWNYLAEQAQAIIKINILFPLKADARDGTSPKFVAWAKSRNLDQNAAFIYEVMKMPGPVLFLAITGDPRGIPLLRQGLTSPNSIIQVASARGLAELRDKSSVPLIIAACKKASASERTALAESLLYFDDSQAQTYAALNLPKTNYAAVRQRIAQGHTPFH